LSSTLETLSWLEQKLKWALEKPSERVGQLYRELAEKQCQVYHAIRNAIIPELASYVDELVVVLVGFKPKCNEEEARNVAGTTTREEGEGSAKAASVGGEGGEGEGAEGSRSKADEVSADRGRGDSVAVAVEGRVQGENDKHNIRHDRTGTQTSSVTRAEQG